MSIGSQLLDDIKFVETKTVLMSQVRFDKNNPNVMSDQKHESLDKVIIKYGFAKDPWLNENKDGTYLVIDGEQGIRRMQAHNVKKFQAKIFQVSYVEVQMLRQIANKLHGEHDRKKDANEFKAIFDDDKLDLFSELSDIPIDDIKFELEKEFDITFEKQEEQEIPEPPVTPKSKLGDIYQLGNHRVMCGDSTKDLDKLLLNKKVKLLLSDPPYGVDYASKNQFLNSIGKPNIIEKPIENDNIKNYRQWFKEWLDKIPFENKNSYYLTMSDQKLVDLSLALVDCGYKISQYLIWKKNNHVLGRQDYQNIHELIIYGWKGTHEYFGGFNTTVWEINRPQSNKLHPTMKPIELMIKPIKNNSKKNEIILDPFLGSGSTLIACEQTNRICYGMELDPGYVDVIVQRYENFTGKKAKLVSNNQ